MLISRHELNKAEEEIFEYLRLCQLYAYEVDDQVCVTAGPDYTFRVTESAPSGKKQEPYELTIHNGHIFNDNGDDVIEIIKSADDGCDEYIALIKTFEKKWYK